MRIEKYNYRNLKVIDYHISNVSEDYLYEHFNEFYTRINIIRHNSENDYKTYKYARKLLIKLNKICPSRRIPKI